MSRLLLDRARKSQRGTGLTGHALAAGYQLDVEDSVHRVHGCLILGCLTDQTLLVSEGDKRRRCEAALLVGDDLDIGALICGDTRVRSA